MNMNHDSKKEVMERVTLRLTESQTNYLTELSQEFGTTKSVIVRMIIQSYMKRHKGV